MTHQEPAAQTQVHNGLISMFLTWGRFISWTVLLSLLVAVLFALAVNGCAISK